MDYYPPPKSRLDMNNDYSTGFSDGYITALDEMISVCEFTLCVIENIPVDTAAISTIKSISAECHRKKIALEN